jgi:hypothetical protein
MSDYYWLPEDEWLKLLHRLRSSIADRLFILRKYGQGDYVDGAIEEIMDDVEQGLDIVRGKDKPIVRRKIINPRD